MLGQVLANILEHLVGIAREGRWRRVCPALARNDRAHHGSTIEFHLEEDLHHARTSQGGRALAPRTTWQTADVGCGDPSFVTTSAPCRMKRHGWVCASIF